MGSCSLSESLKLIASYVRNIPELLYSSLLRRLDHKVSVSLQLRVLFYYTTLIPYAYDSFYAS
jgi:hypothetical protein